MASSVGQAATINSYFEPGYNGAQDTDRDRILDKTGAVKTTGAFVEGDIFEALLRFDSIQQLDSTLAITTDTSIQPNYTSNKYGLYAYSAVAIDTIVDSLTVPGAKDVTFKAAAGSSMIDLYEGTLNTNPFNQTATNAISAVQGLSLIGQFGIGEGDDFWTATISTTVDALSVAIQQAIFSSGEYGLSVLTNAGNLPIEKNGIVGKDGNLHDIIGKSSVEGPAAASSGWKVTTDTKVYFHSVPEPDSLALLGLGALLLSATAKRRQNV